VVLDKLDPEIIDPLVLNKFDPKKIDSLVLNKLYEKKFESLYKEMKNQLKSNIQSSLTSLVAKSDTMLFVSLIPYLVKICLRVIKQMDKQQKNLTPPMT
jgi:hypothetical protein